MKSEWLTYKGKTFFFLRYSHLDLDGLQAEVAEVEAVLMQSPPHSARLLIDSTGTIISPSTLDVFKQTAVRMKSYIRKTAVLGATGVRKFLLDIIIQFSGLPIVAFDDFESAREWLVAE